MTCAHVVSTGLFLVVLLRVRVCTAIRKRCVNMSTMVQYILLSHRASWINLFNTWIMYNSLKSLAHTCAWVCCVFHVCIQHVWLVFINTNYCCLFGGVWAWTQLQFKFGGSSCMRWCTWYVLCSWGSVLHSHWNINMTTICGNCPFKYYIVAVYEIQGTLLLWLHHNHVFANKVVNYECQWTVHITKL